MPCMVPAIGVTYARTRRVPGPSGATGRPGGQRATHGHTSRQARFRPQRTRARVPGTIPAGPACTRNGAGNGSRRPELTTCWFARESRRISANLGHIRPKSCWFGTTWPISTTALQAVLVAYCAVARAGAAGSVLVGGLGDLAWRALLRMLEAFGPLSVA